MNKWILFLIVAIFCIGTVEAQDAEPQRVEVQATDGLTLVGDFYPLADGEAPAVLLLHGGWVEARHTWDPLVQPLLDAGYQVLAVDTRGYGDTGGSDSLRAEQTDVQTWLAWLHEQSTVRDDAISLIGASAGSSLALVGCSGDELCVTAILLSPANLPLVPEDDVLTDAALQPSFLVINGDGDIESLTRLRRMVELVQGGDVGVRIYPSLTHGTDLFGDENIHDSLIALIIDWLDEHTPAA